MRFWEEDIAVHVLRDVEFDDAESCPDYFFEFVVGCDFYGHHFTLIDVEVDVGG